MQSSTGSSCCIPFYVDHGGQDFSQGIVGRFNFGIDKWFSLCNISRQLVSTKHTLAALYSLFMVDTFYKYIETRSALAHLLLEGSKVEMNAFLQKKWLSHKNTAWSSGARY